jgi:hypothetical protein
MNERLDIENFLYAFQQHTGAPLVVSQNMALAMREQGVDIDRLVSVGWMTITRPIQIERRHGPNTR